VPVTDFDFDPEKIYHNIVSAGEEWADKQAAADLLEETRKPILAELMNSENQGLSMAARESLALSSPAYRLHITNMVAARKEANRSRIRYDAVKVLAEMRRSQESTRRAEMRL
jgi:hypothetical protein